MHRDYEKNVYQFHLVSYNHENLISDCLNSIKSQLLLYGTNKEVELFIIDDCSLDKTKEIIELWVNENENLFYRISFKFNNQNLGIKNNLLKLRNQITSFRYMIIAGDDRLLTSNSVFDFMDFCFDKEIVFSVYLISSKFRLRQYFYWIRMEYFLKFPDRLSKYIFDINLFPAPGSYVSPLLLHDEDFIDYYLHSERDSEDYDTWEYYFGYKKKSFHIWYKPFYDYYPSINRFNVIIYKPLVFRVLNRVRLIIFDNLSRNQLIQTTLSSFLILLSLTKIKIYIKLLKDTFRVI
jgi:hypothetical protein